jgi:hypothetical protein
MEKTLQYITIPIYSTSLIIDLSEIFQEEEPPVLYLTAFSRHSGKKHGDKQ